MIDPAKALFAELAAMRREIRNHSLGDVSLNELLAMAQRLEHAYDYAAEMELGASGFDNMDSVRHYSDLQGHLLAAAEEIASVCRAVLKHEARW